MQTGARRLCSLKDGFVRVGSNLFRTLCPSSAGFRHELPREIHPAQQLLEVGIRAPEVEIMTVGIDAH